MNEFPEDVKDICEDMLARTGAAIMSGDFHSFLSCFHLPQKMETFSGYRMIETADDLRAVFDGVRKYMRDKGITRMVRRNINANFQDADTIVAMHETRMLRGTFLAQPTYPSFSVLRRMNGVWKLTDTIYAIKDSAEHEAALTRSKRPDTSQ